VARVVCARCSKNNVVAEGIAVRAISNVVTIGTQTWNGVNSAGVDAEWTAELAEMTDASPTFTQPTITPVRADAYVQASWEVLQDSTVGEQLGTLFADAKERLEDAAWATGSGSTQPTGFISTLSATTTSKVSATTNTAYGALDCFALAQNLSARYQANASWVMHPSIALETRRFALASGNVSSAFWADLGSGTHTARLSGEVQHRHDLDPEREHKLDRLRADVRRLPPGLHHRRPASSPGGEPPGSSSTQTPRGFLSVSSGASTPPAPGSFVSVPEAKGSSRLSKPFTGRDGTCAPTTMPPNLGYFLAGFGGVVARDGPRSPWEGWSGGRPWCLGEAQEPRA
jgi:Phage capsid family